MSRMKKVSITFSAVETLKASVGEIAKSMGNTRSKDGVEQPEFTPTIVSMLEFAVSHEEDYRGWVAHGKSDGTSTKTKIVVKKAPKK